MAGEDDGVARFYCLSVFVLKPTGYVVVSGFKTVVGFKCRASHTKRGRSEIDVLEPITQACRFCSTEAEHDQLLLVVGELQHLGVAFHVTYRLPILHAASGLVVRCFVLGEEQDRSTNSTAVALQDNADTAIVSRSYNHVGISSARAAVVAVAAGTPRAPSFEREATYVVPRAPAVVRAEDVCISEAGEAVVSVILGAVTVTHERSALRFVFWTATIAQGGFFNGMITGTAPAHWTDAFRK